MADTPLMKQYKEIKSNFEDSILFFRLGDFYEMFFEDAVKASRELGLTLTSRNKEKNVDVPLAGVPFHSADSYITKLVSKGYKVAICEQTEDPKMAKGIVKREVVKIITPGTVVDVEALDAKSNNYLMSILKIENKFGIAYVDITTGEFKVTEVEKDDDFVKLFNEINKIEPKEVLVTEDFYEEIKEKLDDFLQKNDSVVTFVNKVRDSAKYLMDYFEIVSLESYGIKDKKAIIGAAAMALDYAATMQVEHELTVEKIEFVNISNYAEINAITSRNLELLKNQREKTVYGSLLWVLDECKTSMGTRLLKRFINNPLLNVDKIKKRQEDVQYFIDNILIREDLREKLENIYDLERLLGKITFGSENGKDLTALKKTIKSAVEIMKILGNTDFFKDIDANILFECYKIIDDSINEDAPFSVREGGIIKSGYNAELDEIRNIMNSGKDFLLDIEQREREATGIRNMKIKFNKVFGYFIEITKANLDMVPEHYIRKQTLSNSERYITPELKKYEDTIINSKAKIEDLEYHLFKGISGKIKEHRKILSELAERLAYIDVMVSFAVSAIENDYAKPEMNEEYFFEIEGGRHPVVEKLIGRTDYVSNDTVFTEKESFVVLTGPNMSGKSTYMKQIALISIMAQIGSFVPAKKANLSVIDKYLTRIGASDDILTGQSTFMVEMSEVSNILNNATEKSLIILDEVGRGTSTTDGVSIATAISMYIHDKIGAKTVFATHYHELTDLENKFAHIVNYRIEVDEKQGKVMFLRNIVKGGADKSYGIEVAKLAGLPKEILVESKKVLKRLEQKKELIERTVDVHQLSLFGGNLEFEDNFDEAEKDFKNVENNQFYEEKLAQIEEEKEKLRKIMNKIEDYDINNITPMDAMKFLFELKENMKKDNK
ncbi:DNA mismatch repair protein MutS [Leptotrichia wadei]|uniref:DNA mismatch repair protein MutS n=1 Tax=Leptotrichia wadei TaxID=157687 RepID=A0A134AJP4_9FUSO|nr:DNA mismatch repair protein MutS [Leptotrichia wadei]KXB67953.1 DNA mismatch repair protein MutS [Leptotrichia wadei]BBM49128.1 DNA mismatch repair protein MutS [Leptotrichia wadei]